MKSDSPLTVPAATRALACLLGLLGGCAAQKPEGAPGPVRNVIVVSLDTCRRDHLEPYGYARPTSPNLARLARSGAVFESAFAQANETVYSHAALFSSRYPRRLSAFDYTFRLPEGVPTLAERFSAHGFRTAGFVGGAHLKSTYGMSRGFERYYDEKDFGSLFHTVPPALQWLEEHAAEPFYLFLHGYDCHSNYLKPFFFDHLYDPDYRGEIADQIVKDPFGVERIYKGSWFPGLKPYTSRTPSGRNVLNEDFFQVVMPGAKERGEPAIDLSAEDLTHLVSHYDGGVTYGDLWLGVVMARLRALGLAEKTLIVVLSDHGEDLHQHGFFHHRPVLRHATVRVPLVIHAPMFPASVATRVKPLVELIDLMPTLLEAAGLPVPASLDGASFLPLLTGKGTFEPRPYAFSESRACLGVHSPDAELVVHKAQDIPDFSSAQAFRLDGSNERSLDASAPEARKMRAALQDWLEGGSAR